MFSAPDSINRIKRRTITMLVQSPNPRKDIGIKDVHLVVVIYVLKQTYYLQRQDQFFFIIRLIFIKY